MKKSFLFAALVSLMIVQSAWAVSIETVVNEAEGYVDVTFLHDVEFLLVIDGRLPVFVIGDAVTAGNFGGFSCSGLSFTIEGESNEIISFYNRSQGVEYGFNENDCFFLGEGTPDTFVAGNVVVLNAGTMRVVVDNFDDYQFVATGDYEVFILDYESGERMSNSGVVATNEVTIDQVKVLYR